MSDDCCCICLTEPVAPEHRVHDCHNSSLHWICASCQQHHPGLQQCPLCRSPWGPEEIPPPLAPVESFKAACHPIYCLLVWIAISCSGIALVRMLVNAPSLGSALPVLYASAVFFGTLVSGMTRHIRQRQ